MTEELSGNGGEKDQDSKNPTDILKNMPTFDEHMKDLEANSNEPGRSMSDFEKMYGRERVERDQYELEETKRNIRVGQEGRKNDTKSLPKIAEKFIARGVVNYGWLGNRPREDNTKPFTTRELVSADGFDDFCNRIDTATIIERPNNKELVIGLDVTINPNKDDLLDKLYRTTNDKKAMLPFGFSQLEYAYNIETRGMEPEMPLVPRFVVGFDGDRIKSLQTMLDEQKSDNKEIRDAAEQREVKKDAEFRFKTLSAIFEQIGLSLKMLPEKRALGQVHEAEEQLKQIRKTIWPALDRATFDCIKNNVVLCRVNNKKIGRKVNEFRQGIKENKDPRVRQVLKRQRYEYIRDVLAHREDDGKGLYAPTDNTYESLMDSIDILKVAAEEGRLKNLTEPQSRAEKKKVIFDQEGNINKIIRG